ncbi:TauD/TfdA dioxygenase family protein [Gluconacetobacter asukensis]|uniref:TauD/TfdA family dioxygenase n=1 Tax=Gluconacetobacter asukensis TaxID=1017181 RepID=A0A7W4J2L6_9PROT|nr:TauD/TfdA family dioxygenase [Gluconacetobacter asukensis]MBB2173570.1 TauD/TfdA family dioxygenase [Gluconacetobacter asukensis]
MPDTNNEFRVERVTGNIGAIIRGVNAAAPISDGLAAKLREALWEYKVIFLRDQHDMTDESQVIFASRMGKVIAAAHPTHGGKEGHPMISALDSEDKITKTNRWHTDTTFVDTIPAGAVLRAITLPPYGGDTMWANTEKAYMDMPEHLKAFLEKAWAVHSNRWGYAHARTIDGDLPPTSEESPFGGTGFSGNPFEAIHPLVRIHPHTKRPTIIAGNHLRHILGLGAAASFEMLSIIQQYITVAENTVRWRWAPGDIAVWDNEATQHLAVADYHHRRVMHRISLVGEPPVSMDGRTGYQRIGHFMPIVPSPVSL